jgi:hypothetical protein
MTQDTPKELFEKGLLSEDQFIKIDGIHSGKIVSVFYDLRSLLYLGVLLFTTGAGILIYQNIGDLGHLLAILALILLTLVCFGYAFRYGPAYSNGTVKGPTPYFDYIVLLGSLLFISVLGYLQFQYEIFNNELGIVTLVTAAVMFYVAYRFDHLGVLSLAITAFASFWSISISPQKWASGEIVNPHHLFNTAILFGAGLCAAALFLDRRSIKKHFTFTYLNFGSLIFFIGSIVGLFSDGIYVIYLVVIGGGCYFAWYMAKQHKSFMFLLYAFIAAYIGTTFILATFILNQFIELWFFYSFASCGGFIFFIIRYRNYFNRTA